MARKLLFYTYAFGGGGAEIVFARLAAAFAAQGDEAILAVDTPGAPPRAEGLRTIVLPAGHAASMRALAALLRSERPDASFSALGANNMKHLAAAILAGRRRQCVLGYHGFAVAEAKPFAQASFRLAALTTRLAARTICVSDALLDEMRRRWGASRERTLRIYNPLPDAPVPPAADAPRAKLVVAIGRFVTVKRFPDLVAAFGAMGDPLARLAILGEGPERAAILAAIRRHGLEACVEMPGHVDPAPWYRRAACVAIASQSESFGLTAAEALAHGVPVVTTDCGGPPEILGHGRYGRIVPVGDVAALATALQETLAAPGDPTPLIARAQDFALPVIRDAYAALADALG